MKTDGYASPRNGHGKTRLDIKVPLRAVAQPRFRRLALDDLPLLHRWLNDPEVVRWWEGDDVSWEAVVRDDGPHRTDATELWLAQDGGREVGWIECYPAAAYAEEDETRHWWALGVARTAAGIDYLVAEAEERGRGLGSAMIRGFVRDDVFGRHREWTQVCASPRAANVASCRVLEKAGFTFRAEFDDDLGGYRLFVADRSTWASAP